MLNKFEEKSKNNEPMRGLGEGQKGCHGICWQCLAKNAS
jgi:hypothetical protein